VARSCLECGFIHRGRCAPKPTKLQVLDVISLLELRQFKFPRDEEELARVREVRDLAIEQLQDDVYLTTRARDRVGRAYIVPRDMSRKDSEKDAFEMFPPRTEEDHALQLALEPFLDKLTPDERVLVRLYFDAGETQKEIARRLSVRRATVNRRLGAIYQKLKTLLLAEFVPEQEQEEEIP